jgi:hypothetical protein
VTTYSQLITNTYIFLTKRGFSRSLRDSSFRVNLAKLQYSKEKRREEKRREEKRREEKRREEKRREEKDLFYIIEGFIYYSV